MPDCAEAYREVASIPPEMAKGMQNPLIFINGKLETINIEKVVEYLKEHPK